MTTPFAPLTHDELQQLDEFLLDDVDSEEVMTLDMADGLLHAVAVGPTTIHPAQWIPVVLGAEDMRTPMGSIKRFDHFVGLLVRHYNSILDRLEQDPPEVFPQWFICTGAGEGTDGGAAREYEDAEAWTFGFVAGMKLCWDDWQPLLSTPDGRALYRPIGLMGEDDFSPDQTELTKTPAMREALTLQIPQAVLGMHAHWLPYRFALHEREVAKVLTPKVGRNEKCPCGSGKKFKMCCGAATDLH